MAGKTCVSETIPMVDSNGREIGRLIVYGEPGELDRVPEAEAREHGEGEIHLKEGCLYDYELVDASPGLRIKEVDGIVRRDGIFKRGGTLDVHRSAVFDAGRIEPKLHVGILPIEVEDDQGRTVGGGIVEICSTKIDYRSHYKCMLYDIAEQCTELLLDFRSPVQAQFAPDPGRDSHTIHQRYAFLRSLMTSSRFREALSRIVSMPHMTLVHEDGRQMIWNSRRLGSGNLRQLSVGTPRISLPVDHPLRARMAKRGLDMPTVPRQMTGRRPRNTLDTAENRFVKHALSTYASFLDSMARSVRAEGRTSDYALLKDMANLRMQLEQVLAEPFFRAISRPSVIPLWSPVLQRKPGYREFLQTWLSFGLAAQLIWSGGDDVYGAGKKDMDVLYEYWVFFALLDLAKRKFDLDKPPSQVLIEPTGNRLDLKLKAGRTLNIEGGCKRFSRDMRVQFSYNRTFSPSTDCASDGSWTRPMRPDYTLSIWPADFGAKEAESQGLMAHLHFDAKYRIDDLEKLVGGTIWKNDDIEIERLEEKRGIYKRGDLLKMHAYRDAIRRSQGAYVIYPGDTNDRWQTYHEILPGLGAFALRPGMEDRQNGLRALGEFIDDVVKHVCDRATQRERLGYYQYVVSRETPHTSVTAALPERVAGSDERAVPPADEWALVIPECASNLPGIRETGFIQLGVEASPPLSLDPSLILAKYALVANKTSGTASLWQICSVELDVPRRDASSENEGQQPSMYLVYRIRRPEFASGTQWDLDALGSLSKPVGCARAVKLDVLLSLAR